jgi:hypothetical protein
MFAQSRGWTIDPAAPGLLAVTILRYQAYCEIHRAPDTPKPSFDRWDQTVADVSPVEGTDSTVDPTPPAP